MEECIAAIATPLAPAGIGVVRLSGENSIEIANNFFKPTQKEELIKIKGYTAAYGFVMEDGLKVDDGVALIFRAPHSYTGEDVVEISCHGGILILEKVLKLCFKFGAKPAQNGEFTKRAYLNSKMSLTQAESVMELIYAESEMELKAANAMKKGELNKEIKKIYDEILKVNGEVQASLEFPEEDEINLSLEEVRAKLRGLISKLEVIEENHELGKLVKDGYDVVLIGEPNVGKSTILNKISGSERSIVTEISGTTRDVVESRVRIGGFNFNFQDTAGIRETEDFIEQIGVKKAKEKAKEANLILFVVDASKKVSDQGIEILENYAGYSTICILNKTDLGDVNLKLDDAKFSAIVRTSVKDEESFNKLKEEVLKVSGLNKLSNDGEIKVNGRQVRLIEGAKEELKEAVRVIDEGENEDVLSLMLERGMKNLAELMGEDCTQEVLNEIFSKFCIGK